MAEKDLRETNKEVAQKYAESKGKKSIGEITSRANELMESDNAIDRALGRAIAQETVQDLMLLCLRQEIMDNPLPDYMNLTERVFDGWMTEGNQKEYVADLDTGVSTYSNEPFVPEHQTMQKLEKWILQVYTKQGSNVVLSPQAYQFKKEQTLPINEWLPYFKKNALNEYITKKQQSLNRAYKIFIYNKLCTIITKQTDGKVINGTSTNLYDALLELAPEIDGMLFYNYKYNADQSTKLPYAANSKDILIFTSRKVRSAIMNGIKSQSFNAQFVGTSERTYTYDNVKCLGDKVVQGNQNTVNTVTDEWLDDNTIIVIDISRIRHIYKLMKMQHKGLLLT